MAALTHTHTHTLTQMRAALEALFDLYVRSLFQNPIRLKSPEGEQNRGGRGEVRSTEVESNRSLTHTFMCLCMLLEQCSGAAGAQQSVVDVACQDGVPLIRWKETRSNCMCVWWRVLFGSDLICLLHATL